jgi:protein-L-isoaspartate(D-aspartate) O-methyltransferase
VSDLDAERNRMIVEQLEGRGIADRRVLDAMARVPREAFVGESDRKRAYLDMPLRIGYGQTISQPYMVAIICQTADVREGDRVLDIGTGSGYQAAVLAELGADVHTVERIPELAEQARERLEKAG